MDAKRKLKRIWKEHLEPILLKIGFFQTRLLLYVLYVLFLPISFALNIRRMKKKDLKSNWKKLPNQSISLKEGRNQF